MHQYCYFYCWHYSSLCCWSWFEVRNLRVQVLVQPWWKPLSRARRKDGTFLWQKKRSSSSVRWLWSGLVLAFCWLWSRLADWIRFFDLNRLPRRCTQNRCSFSLDTNFLRWLENPVELAFELEERHKRECEKSCCLDANFVTLLSVSNIQISIHVRKCINWLSFLGQPFPDSIAFVLAGLYAAFSFI